MTGAAFFLYKDFLKLLEAFGDCQHPKCIILEERYRFWQAVIHFAAVTALRREAILGLRLSDVDFTENFVTVHPEIDKKNKVRYKPLTAELVAEILELHRFIEWSVLPAKCQGKLFPWRHGDKKWYECWNAAEKKIGKRFHLHDLKRFSGELALRAGATPMELQQHMDHADLRTTLEHYCRPTTTNLVNKFKVPGASKKVIRERLTPMFTEPEIKAEIENMITRKLLEQGCDADTIRFVLDNYGNVEVSSRSRQPRQKGGKRKSGYEDEAKNAGDLFWNTTEEGGAV